MKLLMQTLMVFFGTLLTAGLVALGEPSSSGRQPAAQALQLTSVPTASAPAEPAVTPMAQWESGPAENSRPVAR